MSDTPPVVTPIVTETPAPVAPVAVPAPAAPVVPETPVVNAEPTPAPVVAPVPTPAVETPVAQETPVVNVEPVVETPVEPVVETPVEPVVENPAVEEPAISVVAAIAESLAVGEVHRDNNGYILVAKNDLTTNVAALLGDY